MRGVSDGDEVVISTSNGSLTIRTRVTDDVHPETVSLTHGWRGANVSMLTTSEIVDHLTGMVVQTAIPVGIRRR